MERSSIASRSIAAITLSVMLGCGASAAIARDTGGVSEPRLQSSVLRITPGADATGLAHAVRTNMIGVIGTADRLDHRSFTTLARLAADQGDPRGRVYIFDPSSPVLRPTESARASDWIPRPQPGMGFAVVSTLLLGVFYLFRRVS